MNPIFPLAMAVAVGFGLFAGVVPAGVQAAANDTPNATASPTPAPTPEPTPASDPPAGSGGVQSLDEDTNLTAWSYEDGVFTVTFEHTGPPTRLTFTEATQPGEGVSRFTVRREVITAGTTTLRIRSRTSGGAAALGIASPQSIRQGHGIILSTGQPDGSDPFDSFGGASGVFSGVGISVLLSGGAAAWVLWREESGVIEA